jgi:hypothetical protein
MEEIQPPLQQKPKNHMTSLILTQNQYKAIKQHSFETGLTMGEFIRNLINRELGLKNEKV